jgi:chorismate synthase
MLRYLTAGESHGPCLTTIIEGIPAGLKLNAEAVNAQLERRQRGYGRGKRMLIERDRVRITSGVRGGFTLGSPVCLEIQNRDWDNWRDYMAPDIEANLKEKRITQPRPGHADLAGGIKYRHRDLRNVLERASARETAARVAAGSVARVFLEALGVIINSHVVRIGEVEVDYKDLNLGNIAEAAKSPVMCIDAEKSEEMVEAIAQAAQAGESLGGVFEVLIDNVPAGLGSYVHWDRRLDGLLAQAFLSIPGIKGIEFGLGFKGASMFGSEVHDEIHYSEECGFYRTTNNAGGIEGGMSNGERIIIRAAMKPIPTLVNSLTSVDILTKTPVKAAVERADVCAVPAASVVGEAAAAFTLAQVFLEKFGGDYMEEVFANVARYRGYERQV